MERDYYVSVVDPQNTKKRGFLLGPYADHAEALANVERGRVLANKANAWAAFYAFGTASADKGTAIKTVFGN